jgi:hypothetical protein
MITYARTFGHVSFIRLAGTLVLSSNGYGRNLPKPPRTLSFYQSTGVGDAATGSKFWAKAPSFALNVT